MLQMCYSLLAFRFRKLLYVFVSIQAGKYSELRVHHSVIRSHRQTVLVSFRTDTSQTDNNKNEAYRMC